MLSQVESVIYWDLSQTVYKNIHVQSMDVGESIWANLLFESDHVLIHGPGAMHAGTVSAASGALEVKA